MKNSARVNFREAGKEAQAQDAAAVATQQSALAPEDAPAPAAPEQGSFNWYKNWYPVAIADDLDPLKPFATKLLGKELVVWRDAEGQWRCFQDKCPHRLAPLSEGRIEPSDGTLQCSYHGWRYSGSGTAAAIPQAHFDGEQVERTAIASKRSCVASYPTQVLLGMIWVWPESGLVAFIESAAVEPAVNQRVRDIDPGKVALTTNQNYVRDFTVAYDILYENISDQSHVPFAHHGVANNRTSPWAAHFAVTNVKGDLGSADGYMYDLEWSPDAINPPIRQRVRGVPPTYIEYFTPKENGAFTALWFHVVPLDEHTTRVFNHAVIVQPMHPALKALAAARPRWIDHMLLNEIFDGDMAYLAKASQYAKERDPGGNTWAQDYYLPAGADKSAIAFRKWYHGRGAGGYVRAAGGTPSRPPQLTREQIMDRWHQHTAHCPSCSKALARARGGQQVMAALAAAMVLLTAARLGVGAAPASLAAIGPMAAAAGALAFSRLLTRKLQAWIWR
ncbi:hypothetical protein WJX81_007403 [Elliptochloris bilobata]|uniref:Rieske domain-containing protein n=1 Tax=Elliptochloris bilobata TaxID=381761 RepID=A0AAW1RNV9_9CHLO